MGRLETGSQVRIRSTTFPKWDGLLCVLLTVNGSVAYLQPLEDRPDGGTDPVFCNVRFLVPAEDEMNLEET